MGDGRGGCAGDVARAVAGRGEPTCQSPFPHGGRRPGEACALRVAIGLCGPSLVPEQGDLGLGSKLEDEVIALHGLEGASGVVVPFVESGELGLGDSRLRFRAGELLVEGSDLCIGDGEGAAEVGAAAPVLMNSRGRSLPLALERLRSAPPVRGLVGEAVELPLSFWRSSSRELPLSQTRMQGPSACTSVRRAPRWGECGRGDRSGGR